MEAKVEQRSRLRGFASGAREIDEAPLGVRGCLPDWLRGNLLLNGPALWDLPGGSLDHWFDGYAMRHRLRFGADGRVSYRSRFARSRAYDRSIAASRPVYGEFGTRNPASLLQRLKAPQATDNPAVVMSRHGDGWIAVTETPHASRFDPDSLESLGASDWGHAPETMHLMSAHGFTLPDGSYLNAGIALGPTCTIKLFRVAPGSNRPEVFGRIASKKPGYLHGFALAHGHAIVWDCAMRAQPLRFRFSARAYKDCFDWEPAGGARIHAVALADGRVRSWDVPAMFVFHAVQAWADGGDLILEACVYDDARVFDELALAPRRRGEPVASLPRLQRYRLRAGAREAVPEPVADGIELPQVHPDRVGTQRARVAWASGFGTDGAFNDRTLRIDLDTGRISSWQRPAAIHLEPLFVPRPGGSADDDGVLLVPTLADGDAASVVAVVDARTLEPIAEVDAPQVIPFGFHAAFAAH